MTYTKGIPAANNTPAHDQPLMMQNFNQIADSYNTDHVPLNSGSNVGFSNKLTFVDQTAPLPSSAANQLVEYAKSVIYPNAAGTFSELFFQRDAVATEIQMTTGPGNPIVGLNGQTFLPGGLGIKWGSASINSSGTVTYTGVGLTEFPTNTLAVFLTASANARTYNATVVDRNSFTVAASSAGAAVVMWLAIGN